MTLEAFIDSATRRLADRDYVPDEFLGLRNQLGLVQAITQLVEGSEFKGGFLRVLELGLVDWSLEAAVTRYPDRFSNLTVAYACARLRGLFGQNRFLANAGKLTLADAPVSQLDASTEPTVDCLQYAVELMRRAGRPQISEDHREVLSELAWFWYLAGANSERRIAASAKLWPRSSVMLGRRAQRLH